MSQDNDPITLGYAKAVASTPKAVMVTFEDIEDEVDTSAIEDIDAFWVPSSCIHEDSECYSGQSEGSLVVKGWWARKQGLVD